MIIVLPVCGTTLATNSSIWGQINDVVHIHENVANDNEIKIQYMSN